MLEMREQLGELIETVRANVKATSHSATRPCRAHKQKAPASLPGLLAILKQIACEAQYFATTGPPQLNRQTSSLRMVCT